MPCSDATPDVTVVEGMPGAGKTTLLDRLALDGHTVLGEYTTDTGATLGIATHPHHRDHEAHLANWLRKNAQLQRRVTATWVDRDWLTALAWAAGSGGLAKRVNWAYSALSSGRLTVPRRWLILDIPPSVSLRRRAGRLDPRHPWADARVLERVRAFYRSPAATLRGVHPRLAGLVSTVPAHVLDATAPAAVLLRAAEEIGSR